MTGALTRFAPAPTGLLHLGHVVNALYVWGLAARLGVEVLLRVEDHDAQRSRPAFEALLLEDLDWLGFTPHRFPTAAFRRRRCESRQSDRHHIYADAARRLEAAGLLYGCRCTRQEIAAGAPGTAGSLRYAGTCRSRGVPLDESATWRVQLEPGEQRFVDLLQGPQRQTSATHGDPAIRDRHGNWTYAFAVVVDDLTQGVSIVIRGDDLRPATADQIALARLLDRAEPPAFGHHPVVMKSPTQKLSKADGDTGISELRRLGWPAPRVIGHAASLVGLVPPGIDVRAADAPGLFTAVQLASS